MHRTNHSKELASPNVCRAKAGTLPGSMSSFATQRTKYHLCRGSHSEKLGHLRHLKRTSELDLHPQRTFETLWFITQEHFSESQYVPWHTWENLQELRHLPQQPSRSLSCPAQISASVYPLLQPFWLFPPAHSLDPAPHRPGAGKQRHCHLRQAGLLCLPSEINISVYTHECTHTLTRESERN
jgi:hypothetical protein